MTLMYQGSFVIAAIALHVAPGLLRNQAVNVADAVDANDIGSK
jgi:hypothetical protein